MQSRFINKLAYPEDRLSKEKRYRGQGHTLDGKKNFCDMLLAHQVQAYEETKYLFKRNYKLLILIVCEAKQIKT